MFVHRKVNELFCVIDIDGIRKFLDGGIGIEEFQNTETPHSMPTRTLVGLIIANYLQIGEIRAMELVPLGKLLRRVYPYGGKVKTASILSRSRREGWHSSTERGPWAVSNLNLPEEVQQVLASYDGVPPGVAAFLRTQPPLNLD